MHPGFVNRRTLIFLAVVIFFAINNLRHPASRNIDFFVKNGLCTKVYWRQRSSPVPPQRQAGTTGYEKKAAKELNR
jgi:hypothetical protein